MGETIQFYVLDTKYKTIDGNIEVYLFGRTPSGEHIIVVDSQFEPYFYVIPKKNVDVTAKIEKLKVEQKDGISEVTRTEKVKKRYFGKDVDAVKVYTKLPRDIPVIKEVIKDWEILESVNEYDIHFVRRYLIDKGITPMMLVEAEVSSIKRRARVPVFQVESIKLTGDETLTEPDILAVDIETYNPEGKNMNAEKNPILMIAVQGKEYQKVVTWKKFDTKHKYIEFVSSEADMLQRFKEIVATQNPDILTGYYSDGFDLPYIAKRAEKYKIRMDLGLDYSDMTISRRMKTEAKISGIVHLDVFRVIMRMFSQSLATDSYTLDAVASEMIGAHKLETDLDKLAETWDTNPAGLEHYCEYNLQDALLTYQLAEKVLPNVLEMVKIVGLPMYEISRMGFSQLVEWYLIKQALAFNEICPNKPNYDAVKERRASTYKGAFVFEPTPGLYKDVVIFDFRSLYPTIISSHNISPGMMNCACCTNTAEKAPVEGEDIWFCTKHKGFLPTVIENLIKHRMRIKDMAKKSKNDLLGARQNNLKILANAFYGYFGFFGARWYSFECANAITAYGRHYIHKVIDGAGKEGFKVLYSDTDSIFLSLEGKSKDEAKKFAESINRELPGIMELEYEGLYPSALFVSAKAGEYGAKKKYALLDSENRLHVKGFETVRRNWSIIAKETQHKVLMMVLKEHNADKALRYVKSIIQDLRDKKVSIEKVILKTQLTKDLDQYSSNSPHVAIAKRLRDKGYEINPGMIIEFVVTEGKGKIGDKSVIPAEVKDNNYDSSYYIDNQVVPSVERILAVLGYSKEDIIADKKQSKLGAFL